MATRVLMGASLDRAARRGNEAYRWTTGRHAPLVEGRGESRVGRCSSSPIAVDTADAGARFGSTPRPRCSSAAARGGCPGGACRGAPGALAAPPAGCRIDETARLGTLGDGEAGDEDQP